MKLGFLKLTLVVILAGLFTGCSLKYTITDPKVSGIQYDITEKKHFVMQVVDQRSNKDFNQKTSNLKNVQLDLANVEDPIKWLSQSLEKEFAALGISLEITSKDLKSPPDLVLMVKKYQIVSRRVSGFSPWESSHSFMGELKAGDQTSSIRAYFFNGKVPVWSMAEVQEPCFETPMSIIVKEIASKINSSALHYTVSGEKVKAINNQIEEQMKSGAKNVCFSLLELGGTNNPEAMKLLIKMADTEDRFSRTCALSAIGKLGAQNEFAFLKKKYEQYREADRFMALKSIGDIGTPEATNFVEKAKHDSQYSSEDGFKNCVDLYLEK
jgi:hypothetical protein